MSMADRDGFIWYDGKLVPWRDATTHVLTHSLHYGLSVFEGVRAYDGELGTAIFRLQDHTRRLFNSAHIYQIPMPFDPDTVNEAQRQVVRENQLKSCYLRPLVSTAPRRWACRPKGARVHVAIAAWPWGAYLGEKRCPRASASGFLLCPPARQRDDAAPRSRPPTPTRSWPIPRPCRTATTKPCCWTPTASWPRARAKTCSWSRTGCSASRKSPRP